MVKVENLTVKFGKLLVLDSVNFFIETGDKAAIIGRNGSGKTTFVETLMGLNKFSNGSIEISKETNHNLKSVFQDVDYDQELNLLELLYFYSRFSNKKLDKQLLEKYELKHVAKKRFKSLSGGEKQKFKLLLCLEFNPSFLILDEISTSLDFQWRVNIVKQIKYYLNKNPNTTLILVSHDPEEIKSLCNKFFLIKDKKITSIADIDTFFGGLKASNYEEY